MDSSTLLSPTCDALATQARRRSSSLLKQRALRTAGSGCSYSQSGLWTSPTAGDHSRGNVPAPSGKKQQNQLSVDVVRWKQWATPNASEMIKSGSSPVMASKALIGGQVMKWAEDAGLKHGHPDLTTVKHGIASGKADLISFRLNPTFVEWLMGWPKGSTSLLPTG